MCCPFYFIVNTVIIHIIINKINKSILIKLFYKRSPLFNYYHFVLKLYMRWYYGVRNNLKEIRMREYLMNQSQFANHLDVPITTYSQWERGTSNPTLETAFVIAKKLNRTIHDIWSYDE